MPKSTGKLGLSLSLPFFLLVGTNEMQPWFPLTNSCDFLSTEKNKIWIKCGKKQGESYVSEASKGVVILKRRKCHLAVGAICIAQFRLIFADLTAVAQKRETNQSASFYLAKHVLAGCFYSCSSPLSAIRDEFYAIIPLQSCASK